MFDRLLRKQYPRDNISRATANGDQQTVRVEYMLRADPSKIASVRSYLERKFPGWTIQDHHETETVFEVFAIEGGPAGQVFEVKVARNFLDDSTPQEIELKLDLWQVGDFLKVTALWPVLVTHNGIEQMR
jgi:hypothetical protein